ncbi:MAG: hypothetical protein ACOYOS_22590 [Syntrophales bacterium]
MKLGGAYSFDREAFSRLAPLATQDGIDLADFTPDAQRRQEGLVIPLMRLTWRLFFPKPANRQYQI